MYSYQVAGTGERFGRLTVIAQADPLGATKRKAWRCQCSCGNEIVVSDTNLRAGKHHSCGCLRREIAAAKRAVNLEGQTFGRLKVLCRAARIGTSAAWLCRCVCGQVTTVKTHLLRNGMTKSCGCLKRDVSAARFFRDLTGKRFHRLTVIERAPAIEGGRKRVRWLCQCDCGSQTVAATDKLTSGKMKSCGCWHRDFVSKHGATSQDRDPLLNSTYHSWQALKQRCTNPNAPGYAYYGGRGISFDPRWKKFEAFLADMGKKPSLDHSIDRIDSAGNYELSNCRWATKSQQASNRSWSTSSAWSGERDARGRFTQ